MKRKSIAYILATAIIVTPLGLVGSNVSDSNATEHLGLFVRSLEINHQSDGRNLSLNFEYISDRGGNASDPKRIQEFIHQFLDAYPADHRALIRALTDGFPDIKSLKSTLDSTDNQNFSTGSTVYYAKRGNLIKESFQLTKRAYLTCNETSQPLNLHISFDSNETVESFDYQLINQAAEEFFPETIVNWQEVKPHLEVHLQENFPSFTHFEAMVSKAK